MSVWAVVPIKPLNRAKSRLAPVLSAEQRERLALGMLLHNLRVLQRAPAIDGVLVVSRDMKALSAARRFSKVQTLQESGTPELNVVLQRARQMMVAWNVKATLILPADVPLVAIEDVEEMVHLGRFMDSLVLATDHLKDGTNAMVCRPPDIIDFDFGEGSYERHKRLGELSGADVYTYESVRLALDVDTPEDLEAYIAQAQAWGIPLINYEQPDKPLLTDL
jgi:2-phospho-L-lactate/phosphoenolpyruvate guanylyltransferase